MKNFILDVLKKIQLIIFSPFRFIQRIFKAYVNGITGPNKFQKEAEKQFNEGKIFVLSKEDDYENFEDFCSKTKHLPGIEDKLEGVTRKK